MILLGHATGDRRWHDRALAVADRLINHAARDQRWLLPEHFTAEWVPDLGYNRDQPEDPFRPLRRDLRALPRSGPDSCSSCIAVRGWADRRGCRSRPRR